MEEKYRLLNYLQSNKHLDNKQININNNDQTKLVISLKSFDLPLFYQESKNNVLISDKSLINNIQCSSIIYFRYRKIESNEEWNFINDIYSKLCEQVYIFYPRIINFYLR